MNKIFIKKTFIGFSIFLFSVPSIAQDGSLDTTFGIGGTTTTNIGVGDDAGNSVALQSDGKIVVVGGGYNGTNSDFALVRYNPNGSLDPTFGSGGKVTTAIGEGDDTGISVVLQPDGKIIVVGGSHNGLNNDFAIIRYTSNGNLDLTFGTDGKVTTDIGIGNDYGSSVAIQSDGKIVVSGQSFNGTKYDVTVLRYEINGDIDTTFGVGGLVTTGIGAL